MGYSIHAALAYVRAFRRAAVCLIAGIGWMACARTPVKNDVRLAESAPAAAAAVPASVEIKSEDSSVTTSLSLARITAIAFEKNPTFEEFTAHRAAARAEILQAAAYPNPEVELGLGFARGIGDSQESGGEIQVGLMQPIEMPGKRRARQAAAEASLPIVETERQAFKSTLRAEVAKAYYRAAYQKAWTLLSEVQIKSLEDVQAVVKKRIAAGEAADSDLVRVNIDVIRARRQMLGQRRQLAAAKIALNALCGGALPRNFELSESLVAALPGVNADQLLLRGESSHPKLRNLELEAKRAEAVIARENTAWWPDLKPGVSLGRELDKHGAAVSLGVEWPLWSHNEGGIAAAQAQLLKIQAQMKTVRNELAGEAGVAIEDYESAREQQGAFAGGLREAAAAGVRAETIRYEQGESDLWRLLEAQRTAQEAEAEYLQSLYDAWVAHAEIERSLGIAEPETIVEK